MFHPPFTSLAAAAALVVPFVIRPAPASAAQGASPPPEERKVAILVYPEVELLDFAGPAEVFAATHGKAGHAFQVYTVAKTRDPITSMGFAKLTPQYSIADCPKPDIVVVPGGSVPADDPELVGWVRACAKDCEIVLSVCNGALLLGASGLLDGLEVTTHKSALQSLALTVPTAKVYTNRRFVDNGRVVTAAGVSAGIDGALHVVARTCGEDAAWATARYMEYDWRPDELARLHAQPGQPVEAAEMLGWCSSIRKLGQERALAGYRALPKPPDEKEMNRWGYTLLRTGRKEDAFALFTFVAALFPTSANAADSLSDACEALGDKAVAIRATKDALARIEKEAGLTDTRKKHLRNASASRLARLEGRTAELKYVCPPCGMHCDGVGYLEEGACPGCMMALVTRDTVAAGK